MRRRLLNLTGGTLACWVVAAGTAHGAVPEFVVSEPCVQRSCVVRVTLDPEEATRMEVDDDLTGGEAGFSPDVRVACAPASSPEAPYLPRRCQVQRRLTRAGTVIVAARLTTSGSSSIRTFRADVRAGGPVAPRERRRKRGSDLPALCRQAKPGDKCQAGGGRRIPGGGEKVSHKGWPAITGVFWQVTGVQGRRFVGGPLNDELLGHHGSDRIWGQGGKDVLWGDWNPRNNTTRQRDFLSGGAGNDWIYSSHGRNTIRGGSGRDYVWAYYGRGSIDCGPGFDTLRIKSDHRYRVRNCERIKNFCAHGSKPGNRGGCYKPGERKAARPGS